MRVIHVLVAFAIYVGLVFTLPMMPKRTMCCEVSSIAAATSKIVYSAPLGAMYQGLFDHFVTNPDVPLQEKLDTVAGVARGVLKDTTQDGNGVGYVLFATVVFELLGFYVWALPLGMIVLMGVSTWAFMREFPKLAIVPVLYFTVLTVMLFSALTWLPGNLDAAGPGSIRYFSLVGILPAFHVALALRYRLQRWRFVVVQAAILSFVVLVRGNAIMLPIAAALFGVANWRRGLRLLLVPLVLASAVMIASPSYVLNGRFHDVLWHRVLMSLVVHPEYPFAGLNEMFDCPIPTGMHSQGDQNGHCVWFDYAKKNNISIVDVVTGTYNSQYETAVRNAFFRIAWHYPREVLGLFLWYKPKLVLETIGNSFVTNWSAYSPLNISLLLVAIANALFLLFSTKTNRAILSFTVLCSGLSIAPLIAVWSYVATSADFIFFTLFVSILATAVFSHTIARWFLSARDLRVTINNYRL